MRYIVAISISAVMIVGMFAYSHWMRGCVKQWCDEQVTLPNITVVGINTAYFIANFWHVIIPFLVGIPLGVAALWPRKKPHEPKES
jgi:hypothetical protein